MKEIKARGLFEAIGLIKKPKLTKKQKREQFIKKMMIKIPGLQEEYKTVFGINLKKQS